jgi:hypothetical protein
MTETKSTRGGRRNPPGGRPPLPENERMKNATFRLTPENLEYLQTIPLGRRGELINRLLDGERKK